MGTDLSKETINLSEKFDINIDEIKKCEHMKLVYNGVNVKSLSVNDIKDAFYKINICYYRNTNNVIYNVNNRIKITFNNNKEIMIYLSNCGQYAGIMTTDCGLGIWFYLIDSKDKCNNPFQELINQNQ